LARVLAAVVGAFAVTTSLLLGMNQVAEQLKLRDPTKYFRITDVIVLPAPRRPARPRSPELPPERAAPELSPSAPARPEPPVRPAEPSRPAPEAAPPVLGEA